MFDLLRLYFRNVNRFHNSNIHVLYCPTFLQLYFFKDYFQKVDSNMLKGQKKEITAVVKVLDTFLSKSWRKLNYGPNLKHVNTDHSKKFRSKKNTIFC